MNSDYTLNSDTNLPWTAYPFVVLALIIFIPLMVVGWVLDFLQYSLCFLGFHRWRVLSSKPHGYDGAVRVVKECKICSVKLTRG